VRTFFIVAAACSGNIKGTDRRVCTASDAYRWKSPPVDTITPVGHVVYADLRCDIDEVWDVPTRMCVIANASVTWDRIRKEVLVAYSNCYPR
jgi:hypothetical protein